MKIEDMLKLVNAGFTAEMIAKFTGIEKSAPASAPAPAPAPAPALAPATELAEITKRLDELTKAVQTGNAVATTAETPKENDVNDVILNLIKEV